MSITIRDSGLVYRNPQPHLYSRHTWHPTLVRMDDGELIVTFDIATAVEALDYCTYLSRSTDDGQTWSTPVRVLEETLSRPTTHSLRIARSKSGELILIGGRFYRDDPERSLVNSANLGFSPMEPILLRSTDRGRTWQKPEVIHPAWVGPAWEICHSLVELSDGRWLWPTSTWRGWDGSAPQGMQAVAVVSHDQGKTWPDIITVNNTTEQGVIQWEQSLVELPDHRLLAVTWVFDEKSGDSLDNAYTISADGQRFGPARSTGLHGQTAKMLSLGDGRIFTLYRRHDQPGLWGNLSRIDGDQWTNLAELRVWHGASSGMTGEGSAAEELSALKFGFPQLTLLPNGEIFAVCWCCESCINNVRWFRIGVEYAGFGERGA